MKKYNYFQINISMSYLKWQLKKPKIKFKIMKN